MASPAFFDSAGWRTEGVQLSPSATTSTRSWEDCQRFRNRSENETAELRRVRLATTLCSAAKSTEIELPDGSTATLPLWPSQGGHTSHRGGLHRSATAGRLSEGRTSSSSCEGTIPNSSSSFRRPASSFENNPSLPTRATTSMKSLAELRADDAAPSCAPAEPRVTLEQKVLLRLSELLSDSLLQAKLSALGVCAEFEEEDVEWVVAGELASRAASNIWPTCKPSTNSSRPCAMVNGRRESIISSTELMQHAKTLRHCSSSRMTFVKAAELFEELVGDPDEEDLCCY